MQLWVRRVIALASLVVLTGVVAGEAVAQGVASAAITGTVTQEGGRPVDGATVVVTNTLTGQRFQVTTRATGRFTFENLPPGGPYTVEVRAIGFQAGRRNGVNLTLGQRLASDFALRSQVVEVQELVVQGQQDVFINRGRTGAANTISDSAVSNLPTLGRSFTDLITTSPAVAAGPGGRPSIAGGNNRFNSIQIDGAVNNDLFGLGSSGAPGGQTQGRAIPLDAVKEFQVLVAPFDVRQGGFAAGLVNAITKSGDNTYRGSFFLFRQGDQFVTKTPEPAGGVFSISQFGGSVSGPIIANKAHFYFSYDQQISTTPFAGDLVGVTFDSVGGAGLTRCNAFADEVRNRGYDPGSCGGFDFEVPTVNFFSKITAQTGTTGQVEFTMNYATSSEQTLIRATNRDYQLTGGGYKIDNSNFSPRLRWTNVFGGRFNNEFQTGFSFLRDPRTPNTPFATVNVQTGAGYNLVTGAEINSHQTATNQNVWELTDNLTFDVGAHRILVGTHNEFFQFQNDFYSQFRGNWTFASLAAFQAGNALSFVRNMGAAAAGIPGGRNDGPSADFAVRQFGFYAQDQFSPLSNLTLTAGARLDVPFFPATPPTNPRLITAMGSTLFDTGDFPSGNAMISPRLGFNYDWAGKGDLIIRGGAGVFAGRPAYVWMANAYSNTGLEQAQINCTGTNVPNFNTYGLDPDNQPTTCLNPGPATAAAANINMFNADFKFPQSLRFSLGVDKRLPMGFVLSVDGMYSNTFSTQYITDMNLTGVYTGTWPDTGIGTLAGEGNRVVYGTFAAGGGVTPTRVTSTFRQVLYHENRGKDYSYSGIFQLNRRFADNFELSAGYTYSRTYDLMSATSSTASSNFGFATLDGTLSNRNLTTSSFDRPHTIKLSGMVHLPYNFEVSMQYVGLSGSPYAYTVGGDANGDGVGSNSNLTGAQNDLFYVPVDAADFLFSTTLEGLPTQRAAAWDSLNAYIDREPCLKDHRGEIMTRNSCRNPWQTFLNASIAWSHETYRGQRIELSLGIFNVLHYLNEDWGVVKQTTGFEGTNIVSRVGYDAATQRGRYALALPQFEQVQRNASRGKMLLGARYTF